MKKSILELLDDYRIADVQTETVDGTMISKVFVESMTNSDTISCVFTIPFESLNAYDLKGYVVS